MCGPSLVRAQKDYGMCRLDVDGDVGGLVYHYGLAPFSRAVYVADRKFTKRA